MEENEIISIIENTPLDLRAEVVIADLIKKGFSVNDLFVQPIGLFKRRFAKDIEKIEMEPLKSKQLALKMKINREGLYDMLPKAIFHDYQTKKPKAFKNIGEMLIESAQRKKEQKDARDFFLIYEIEFFKERLAVELQERKLLETITYSMDDEKILSYWDLPAIFDKRQRGILFYVLPIIHKIRGSLPLMEETYMSILKDKVTIKKTEVSLKSATTEWKFNILGNCQLSKNSVLGQRNNLIYDNLLVEIGPIQTDSIFDYLPNGKNLKILEQLNSFFMPVSLESQIRILTSKTRWFLHSHPVYHGTEKKWILPKEKNESRLGHSIYL